MLSYAQTRTVAYREEDGGLITVDEAEELATDHVDELDPDNLLDGRDREDSIKDAYEALGLQAVSQYELDQYADNLIDDEVEQLTYEPERALALLEETGQFDLYEMQEIVWDAIDDAKKFEMIERFDKYRVRDALVDYVSDGIDNDYIIEQFNG